MDDKTDVGSKHVLRAADVIPPFSDSEDMEMPELNPSSVPAYDLADSILTEQRRLAASRRKRSRQALLEPMASPKERPASEEVLSKPSPVDLAALRQIVADIVARDIEQLSAQPLCSPA
jgi:hypothetical protein